MTTLQGKPTTKGWRIGLLLSALAAGIDPVAAGSPPISPAISSAISPAVSPAVSPAAAPAKPPASRVRPPPEAEAGCPRDRLTLYAGQVAAYTRGPERTTLRIRTDWQTTENVVIRHPGTSDPSRWFLIDGQPFTGAAWARIETRPGQLRTGVRASAWVCEGAHNPLVDWSPPRGP